MYRRIVLTILLNLSQSGWTAYMIAVRYDRQEIVSLLQTKSEVDTVSRETVGLCILTSAMLLSHITIVVQNKIAVGM